MKKIYLYGNWKMNMDKRETRAFFDELSAEFASSQPLFAAAGDVLEVAVFPPFTSLQTAQESAAGFEKKITPFIGAQNVYFESQGAFTGEVSLPMLKEAGCTRVIIGHSERRTLFGEDDALIARKIKACLESGIVPVLCFGETLDERETKKTFDVVSRQLRSALAGLDSSMAQRIVYAYEPVWAIGTGKSATAEEAQEICAYGKKLICELTGADSGVVMLYGGSVKEGNAKELLSKSAIDGALVGGASLKARSFLGIFRACADI